MRLAIMIVAIIAGVVIAVIGIIAALILIGSPKVCADRVIPISAEAVNILTSNWDAFKAQAATRQAFVTLTETEVTSRAVRWVEDEGIELENLQVFLCQGGYAEATATFVGAPGPSVNLLVRGTLELAGERPEIDIQQVGVGNLPGFAPLEAVLNFIPEEKKTLDIDVYLTDISFAEGRVTLEGRPR